MDSDAVRRIGFTKLSSGSEDAAALNIVFVHGLMGHPQNTWQSSTNKQSSSSIKSIFRSKSKIDPETSSALFWPRDLLVQDLQGAIIWTYGYDADAVQGIFTSKNQNSVRQHGNDLKVKIEREIQGPIVFIAHSLGGIIVKYALWQSKMCQTYTKLVIFLGTPHRGSDSGAYGSIAANLAAFALQDMNHRLVRSLEVDSETLNIVNAEFVKVISENKIPVHSFQEGKPMTGVKGLHGKIVPDFSSVLDIDEKLETRETINQDHRNMAKCSSRADEQYHAIFSVLQLHFFKTKVQPVELQQPEINSLATSEYMIPSRNIRFTGRSAQVQELLDRLMVAQTSNDIAICGLGGIGKSQIALEFCHLVKQKYPSFSIFWISALSRAQFEKNYTELATVCGLTIKNKQELLFAVKRHLGTKASGPWIMVIDNADDRNVLFDELSGISQYLPIRDGDATAIKLYTTRDASIGSDLVGFSLVHVEELGVPEAEDLLENCLGQNKRAMDRSAVKELLEELTSIPLAIVQASAFMTKHQISIPKYLSLMKQTDEDRINLLSEDFHDKTQPSRSKNAIATTWLISFETIKEEEPSALELFYFLTFIENKDIPQTMLPAKSELALIKAIGVLRNYSFLSKQGDAGSYNMHRLVHQIGRTWMQKFMSTESPESSYIQHLLEVFPSDEIENRDLWRQYVPHALHVINVTAAAPTEIRATFCLVVGRCLAVDGRLSEALRLLETCYIWRMDNLDSENIALLESRRELAIAYRWHGMERQAIPMLEQVVRQEAQVLHSEDLLRLSSIYELGVAYLWASRYNEAVNRLEHVVKTRKALLSSNHPDLLSAEHSLVLALRSSGRSERATVVLQQNERLDPKSDQHAASTYTTYASTRAPLEPSSDASSRTSAVKTKSNLSKEEQVRLGEMTFEEQVQMNKHIRETTALIGWLAIMHRALSSSSKRYTPSHVLTFEDQLAYSIFWVSSKWTWTQNGGTSAPFDAIIRELEMARNLTPNLGMATASQLAVKADMNKIKSSNRKAKGLISNLPTSPQKWSEKADDHNTRVRRAVATLESLISITQRRIITHFEPTVHKSSEETILVVSGFRAGVADRTNNFDAEVRKLVLSQVSVGNLLLRRYVKALSLMIEKLSSQGIASSQAYKAWSESMLSSPLLIAEGMLAIQKVGLAEFGQPSNANEETVAVFEQRVANAYWKDGQLDESIPRMRKVITTLRSLPTKHQSSLNDAEESLLKMLQAEKNE